MGELTIEGFFSYVAPDTWNTDEFFNWPPDVFALVASLLLKSGAYCYAVSGWKRDETNREWVRDIKSAGKDWRANLAPPPIVLELRQAILNNRTVKVAEVRRHDQLCNVLLRLCSCADEACKGVGCTVSHDDADHFLDEASQLLQASAKAYDFSTLGKLIDHSVVRVLPKLHTPQSGITIRSLTHHLALCPAGDVRAKWAERPRLEPTSERHCINLLLAPWPRWVKPKHFRQVQPPEAELLNMPKHFGFFEYKPPDQNPKDIRLRLETMLYNATQVVDKIDGVVFPEIALTVEQYREVSALLMPEKIFLICGVRESPASSGAAGKNYLRFDIPVDIPPSTGQGPTQAGAYFSHAQDKHHRWRLDKRQIVQYGLGSCLDIEGNWWEHISIDKRELYFVVLDEWLTVCALICEDLARQDPVSEIVRAVGPNLVIALLMDGPQLAQRWPARYATVLADDPGSSVLTLTSVGMSQLSRPPSIQGRSRAMALWKDAKTGEAVTINLPANEDGVILSLSRERETEWAADGRDDGGSSGYPTLSGIHFVNCGSKTTD